MESITTSSQLGFYERMDALVTFAIEQHPSGGEALNAADHLRELGEYLRDGAHELAKDFPNHTHPWICKKLREDAESRLLDSFYAGMGGYYG